MTIVNCKLAPKPNNDIFANLCRQNETDRLEIVFFFVWLLVVWGICVCRWWVLIIVFFMQLSSIMASSQFDLQVVSEYISRVAVVLVILTIFISSCHWVYVIGHTALSNSVLNQWIVCWHEAVLMAALPTFECRKMFVRKLSSVLHQRLLVHVQIPGCQEFPVEESKIINCLLIWDVVFLESVLSDEVKYEISVVL